MQSQMKSQHIITYKVRFIIFVKYRVRFMIVI